MPIRPKITKRAVVGVWLLAAVAWSTLGGAPAGGAATAAGGGVTVAGSVATTLSVDASAAVVPEGSAGAGHFTARLTDANGAGIAGQRVIFRWNEVDSPYAFTDSSGVATLRVDVSGFYPGVHAVEAFYYGDPGRPELAFSSASASFVVPDVAPVATKVSISRASATEVVVSVARVDGKSLPEDQVFPYLYLSADVDVWAGGYPLLHCSTVAGKDAKSCTVPSSTKRIYADYIGNEVSQPASGAPRTPGTPLFLPSSAEADATVLTVKPATLTAGVRASVSGSLTDASSGAPVVGALVEFQVNHNESCRGYTDGSGNVTCSVATYTEGPAYAEAPGSYPLTAQFFGDDRGSQKVLATDAASTVTIVAADPNQPLPTTLRPFGPITARAGAHQRVEAALFTADTNLPIANRPVAFSLGTGQTCTAVTNANGQAICTIDLPQSPGAVTWSVSFAGDNSHSPALTSSSASTNVVIAGPPTS